MTVTLSLEARSVTLPQHIKPASNKPLITQLARRDETQTDCLLHLVLLLDHGLSKRLSTGLHFEGIPILEFLIQENSSWIDQRALLLAEKMCQMTPKPPAHSYPTSKLRPPETATPLAVAACNYNHSGSQTRQFSAQIKALPQF